MKDAFLLDMPLMKASFFSDLIQRKVPAILQSTGLFAFS